MNPHFVKGFADGLIFGALIGAAVLIGYFLWGSSDPFPNTQTGEVTILRGTR